MNKVYSLKYSPVSGGLIAVSEIVRRVTVGRKIYPPYFFLLLLPQPGA